MSPVLIGVTTISNSIDNYEVLFKLAKQAEDESKYLDLIIDLANKGHPKSQLELGSLYLGGFAGVERNMDLALSWFLKAENSYEPDNFFLLGQLYQLGFNGPNKSFKADEEKSKYYYKMALSTYKDRALNGSIKAAYRVSEIYSGGIIGIDKNEAEAKIWYDKYLSLRNKKTTK